MYADEKEIKSRNHIRYHSEKRSITCRISVNWPISDMNRPG